MARGVTFLICDSALRFAAEGLAAKSGRRVEEVHQDLRDGVVRGAVLVPAMIVAIGRAQERGCAYLYSG